MLSFRKICAGLLTGCLLLAAAVVQAAPVTNLRSSVSAARVRLVLDSSEAIKFQQSQKDKQIVITLPESSAKKQQLQLKNTAVKSAQLVPTGKQSAKLVIDMQKSSQFKVYQLHAPERLVVDIYQITLLRQSQQLAKGVTYSFIQDELNGRQIQAYLVSVAPDSGYELRPFSAAGIYNGRGSMAQQAKERGLLAAINASYFDTDGWVIGNVKDNGNFIAMDTQPRSAYAVKDGQQQILQDVAYTGTLRLPDGKTLTIKGMNRARIANDLVLFNSYYAPSTKTNMYGREVKLKNNHVVAISTAGNMTLEPDCVVISGHGSMALALAGLRLGDQVVLQQGLGSAAANAAATVVSGGPLLLEQGRVKVRTTEEQIAADIARGRAPRTAVGLKRDGTLLLLVVDGRSSLSGGLTLTELAQYLLRQGAYNAVNFDGGGSSEMVIRGQVVNKPSDGKERRVSIGLGLIPKR